MIHRGSTLASGGGDSPSTNTDGYAAAVAVNNNTSNTDLGGAAGTESPLSSSNIKSNQMTTIAATTATQNDATDGTGITTDNNNHNHQYRWPERFWTRLKSVSHTVLISKTWRFLLFPSILILLFGPAMQILVLPPKGGNVSATDTTMDVLYSIVLIVFVLDVVLRSIAVPGYFGFRVTRIYQPSHFYATLLNSYNRDGSVKNHTMTTSSSSPTRSSSSSSKKTSSGSMAVSSLLGISPKHHHHQQQQQQQQQQQPHHHQDSTPLRPLTSIERKTRAKAKLLETCFGWLRCIHMGSFLFWCDVCSTFTLLFEISYTNPTSFEMVTHELEVSSNSAKNVMNNARPWELNLGLVVAILKTARVVRLVRSQAVSTLISKVNWYWSIQKMRTYAGYLDFGFHRIFHQDDDFIDDPSHRYGSAGAGAGAGADNNDDFIDTMGVSSKSNNLHRGTEGYQTKRLQPLSEDTASSNSGFCMGGLLSILRSVGLVGSDNTDEQRRLAACKIQRTWRRSVQQRHQDESDDNFRHEKLDTLDENAVANEHGMKSSKVPTSQNNNSNNKKKNRKKSVPKSLRRMSLVSAVDASEISKRISNKLKYTVSRHAAAESHVGGAMRELTGQRVAIGILVALLLTAFFTYVEEDATRHATMMILHAQTTGTRINMDGTQTVTRPPPQSWINMALKAARSSSVPDMYRFDIANGKNVTFVVKENVNRELRDRDRLKIVVRSTNHSDPNNITMTSVGWFVYRQEQRNKAIVQLMSTIFILLLWLFGVTAFAGPVMVLVVLPIERMVRLLGMLMVDPLGYQNSSKYRKFVSEEDELTKNTRWTQEVLKGMETSFLMSTILRIGSLMKVGFGSAGVEIIRKNLEKKHGGNVGLLTSKGITVSCIFLFCDIRQFTDATECLQEEVFVFTNRIAAVVHSFCHSYGGSANKNVGDAFLCSWLLDAPPNDGGSFGGDDGLYAKSNQADKCLLCVVKILMALHHNKYYIGTMSEAPRERLLAKLKKRPGPVVQMGMGLHAGKAVQGAIGSERKIDATYVSEAVEMAEFLESSTKKYGLKMLLSNAFHSLLHPNNRQRCRLVDQIVIPNDEDEDEDVMIYDRDDITELYTYDTDVDALWTAPDGKIKSLTDRSVAENTSQSESESRQGSSDRRVDMKKNISSRAPGSARMGRSGRRRSITGMLGSKSTNLTSSVNSATGRNPLEGSIPDSMGTDHHSVTGDANDGNDLVGFKPPELILPTGPAFYSPTIWRSEQMFKIRKKFLDGLFFHNYSQGLQSFYHRDWERATQSFTAILATFDDGPSRYFLNQIEKYDGKPPSNFKPYGEP